MLLVLFQYSGSLKTYIQYSICPLLQLSIDQPFLSSKHLLNPNFLFSWYPFQFPTYFIYSQLVLSNPFQLPNPNSSNLNIGWHSFGIPHYIIRKKYFILLPTFLHDKWQLANKNFNLTMYYCSMNTFHNTFVCTSYI